MNEDRRPPVGTRVEDKGGYNVPRWARRGRGTIVEHHQYDQYKVCVVWDDQQYGGVQRTWPYASRLKVLENPEEVS